MNPIQEWGQKAKNRNNVTCQIAGEEEEGEFANLFSDQYACIGLASSEGSILHEKYEEIFARQQGWATSYVRSFEEGMKVTKFCFLNTENAVLFTQWFIEEYWNTLMDDCDINTYVQG